MNYSFFILTIDILIILASIFIVRKYITFFHPFSAYLFFHLYAFTKRLWEIEFLNSYLLYSDNINTKSITMEEIYRAMTWADISLISFTLGTLLAHRLKLRVNNKIILKKYKVTLVASIFLILGTPAFILTRNTSGSFGNFEQILNVMSLWPVLSVCLLVYMYGFRWYLLMLLIPFILSLAIQGSDRFMLILPLTFLLSCYLYNKNLKWPNIRVAFLLLILMIIFPQLKYIGMAYQTKNFEEVFLRLEQAFLVKNQIEGSASNFLDQYAGALTLIDESNKFYYGYTYTSLFTLFIPRALWNDKPGVADHTMSIATSDRPYDVEGRIITYLGEAYINFWYIGFLVVPFILSLFLTASYRKNISKGIKSLQVYVFLSFNVILIQVYRDGISSLVLFGIVQNLVMVSIYITHKFKWKN